MSSERSGIVSTIEYKFLRWYSPGEPNVCSGAAFAGRSKLELLGDSVDVRDKVVVDFGCGEGLETVALAKRGARKVIGVDIRTEMLEAARMAAMRAGVGDRCEFVQHLGSKADLVISLDSFEHFEYPAEILRVMHSMLNSSGSVRVSFGPTWYHPLGGHLFSVFPWAHLVLTEKALIQWRSRFKSDGATRFGEVAGGLNQMTIRHFEKLVDVSPLEFKWMECVPIRKLKPLHNGLTREFTTAIVRCELVPKRKVQAAERPESKAQAA